MKARMTNAAMLVPGQGFRDLYNNLNGPVPVLFQVFLQTTLTF